MMDNTIENIRDVQIVDHTDSGPVYRCTVDLFLYKTDPITKEEHLSPDSGPVTCIARATDSYGFGPTVFKAIEAGQITGDIEDIT